MRPLSYIKHLLILALCLLSMNFRGFAETYSGTVDRVVDGDTIRAIIDGRSTRIRLLCIDALEKSDNEKAKKDAARLDQSESVAENGGKEAARYLSTLLSKGDSIRLVTDKKEYDMYGRMLAYIYDANGTFINKKLVADGYAGVLVYSPNEEKAEELSQTFNEAKNAHKGLWAEGLVLPYRWKK